MCHIPKAVHMMVDTNAANGDGVVRCGEVRRSEKVVRRKKRKEKEKERKEKKEREKKKEARKKNLFVVSFGAIFLTHNIKYKQVCHRILLRLHSSSPTRRESQHKPDNEKISLKAAPARIYPPKSSHRG